MQIQGRQCTCTGGARALGLLFLLRFLNALPKFWALGALSVPAGGQQLRCWLAVCVVLWPAREELGHKLLELHIYNHIFITRQCVKLPAQHQCQSSSNVSMHVQNDYTKRLLSGIRHIQGRLSQLHAAA